MKQKSNWVVTNPEPGDHIRVFLDGFYHHGIYCGNNRVIHYASPYGFSIINYDSMTICETEITVFSQNNEVEVRILTGAEKKLCRSTKNILEIAYNRIGEKKYDILFNNCEHFVNECIFGKPKSEIIDSILKHRLGNNPSPGISVFINSFHNYLKGIRS